MKKRTYLLYLIAILAAAGLGMLVVEHQGYVLITWKKIRFESTLWIFLACIALLMGLLLLLRTLLGAMLGSLGWVNPWSGRNRKKRLDDAITNGMMEFSRGNWQPALKHLAYAGKASANPLPYLLSAARSAEKLQQRDTADKLLASARNRHPQDDLAISLCQAELHQQRNQLPQAKAVLQLAREKYGSTAEIMDRLCHIMQDSKDWSSLLGLLPDLRKSKALPENELKQLEQACWQGRLQQADDHQELQKTWSAMPSALHKQPVSLLTYCSRLISLGYSKDAESLLRNQLNQNVNVQLLQAYAQLPHAEPEAAYKSAQRWLEQVPGDAFALLSLGKLAMQAREWAQARDYFQSSLERHPTPQAYAELARLLNQMGDYKASNELLNTSIRLLEQQGS